MTTSLHPDPIRRASDRTARVLFLLFTFLPLAVVLVMVLVLIQRSRPILDYAPLTALLTGIDWMPMRGQFGYFPFIIGTFWVTVIAMILAVPPSLLSAIYLAEYAHPLARSIMKPVLDILAGIPSVVYGVWGVVAVVPWLRETLAPALQPYAGVLPILEAHGTTGFSMMAGGIVLAIMVTPLIISVSTEVLQTVPAGLREASLALGATRLQTIQNAVLRRAAPGMLASCMLGFSRAFGETMAVLMVVGNVPILPASIFDPAYPLTALIANNYGEMLSIPLYDAALMGAALILLVIVLGFNLLSALYLRRTLRRRRR